jgi:hypothetical protein
MKTFVCKMPLPASIAGSNNTVNRAVHDIDDDDDLVAIVHMGLYEYGDIGECDFYRDLDPDYRRIKHSDLSRLLLRSLSRWAG